MRIAAGRGRRYLALRRRAAVRAWRALAPGAKWERRRKRLAAALMIAAAAGITLRADWSILGDLSDRKRQGERDAPAGIPLSEEWVEARQSVLPETQEPGLHFRFDEHGLTFFYVGEETVSGPSD